ncbi:MAG: hypothetical protein ACI94O_002056 [Octadecabacter sp.]
MSVFEGLAVALITVVGLVVVAIIVLSIVDVTQRPDVI